MRKAAGRCIAQVANEATQTLSSCSTSGRHTAERGYIYQRLFASGSESLNRFDWYDPNRDVYKEFQPKWDQANAATAAARAAEAAPQPWAQRHRLRGPGAGASSAHPAGLPVEKDADWPPGYDELLRGYLHQELPLSEREAAQLVEAARRGLMPASRELIRQRYMQIMDLEPRFPGFHAHSAVLSEPRLLRHAASKLMMAMVVFQDQWAAHPVGPLMGRIGRFIVADPIGAGHRLHALARALAAELGVALDPRQLTRGSTFLTCSPYELDARVSAVATIFSRQGAQRLLAADMDVLCFEPQELNAGVKMLREVFSTRGGGPAGKGGNAGKGGPQQYRQEKQPAQKPQQPHVGTPEGAAAAAADRAYVTELAVTWPGVLRLPGRHGAEGLAALVAAVVEAGGERYDGEGGRGVMLADVASGPEKVLRAAAAVAAAAAAGTEAGLAEAQVRLREALAAAVQAREEAAADADAATAAASAGKGSGEGLAGMV